ncbi:ABC transporter ATP-binding protein [Candidatus Bathyarchaeota archaeon]|nr:ABC transporter ATP-binding protein [Candidatus Bathyarchaeota archaeon]
MVDDFIVETQELTKVYRMGKVTIPALDNVDLKVPKGDMLCLYGPSGSGKTTLLNIIGGLAKPTSGRVLVDGVDLTRLKGNELAEFRLRKVGFIFQSFNLIPTLTALENVELPMVYAKVSKSERRRRAVEMLEIVKMGHRLNHKPDELSGGEQQRVAIARALVNSPSIVLADEPTAAIDTASIHMLMKIIQELNSTKGQTFIIVTHDLLVAQACKRSIIMRDGRIERELTGKEIAEAIIASGREKLLR